MDVQKKAALLAEFTDQLNQYGPESPIVKEYCQRFQDVELQQLFRMTVRLQSQLRQGEFRLSSDDDLPARLPAHPNGSRQGRSPA